MKTKFAHNNITQILSKKLGLRILGIILLSLFFFNTFAAPMTGCPIKKRNGSSCYWTTLQSVTHNISGTYTITILVEVDASSGGDGGNGCQALSHFAIQAANDTYSNNATWQKVTGDVTFTGFEYTLGGGNSQSFNTGFKLVNPQNFGDNHAGSFIVTYTLTNLQDQKFAAKAGSYNNDASFTIADFQTVLDCSTNNISGPTAVDDETTTPLNTPVVIDAFFNDIAGSSDINKSYLMFVGETPDPATVGTFTFNNITQKVTFTPANDYTGIATIDYQIKDANNLTSIATIKVTIITGTTNNFPGTGFSTVAFEDLWPFKGDYDMNDLVMDYKFVITSNSNNYVDKVVGTFKIKAFGASFENGFGFQFPNVPNASITSVSGYDLKEGFINLNSNGTESGQNKPTIIVYDNAFKEMTSPGGIGVNTDPTQTYVTSKTLTITINFTPNTCLYSTLDIGNFNPFIFVNKVRGVEVHLPDFAPTSKANQSLFGTGDDNSNPAQGKYYKTANNLPWAINTYEQFDYPKEKVDISQAFIHFAAWATSGGISFTDWYKDLSGYRNAGSIYPIHH